MMKDIETQSHHIHPKFMDNQKGLGKQYILETKEHMILHLKIPAIIWKFVPKHLKQECINEVIRFSEKEICKQIKNKHIDLDVFNKNNENIICPKCEYINDIEDNYCLRCDMVLLNKKKDDEYY